MSRSHKKSQNGVGEEFAMKYKNVFDLTQVRPDKVKVDFQKQTRVHGFYNLYCTMRKNYILGGQINGLT